MSSQRLSSVLAAVVAACGIVAGWGCTTQQRATPVVRADAQHAYERGDYTTSVADWEEYVQRVPQDPEAKWELARALLKTGNPGRATELAWQAFDMRPKNEQFLATLAEALYQSHQNDALYKLLRQQIADYGRVSDYERLGQYSAKLGDADGAEYALTQAAKLDGGKTVGPQLALADFYASIGDKKHELERLRMALYLDPTSKEINERIRKLGEIPGPSLAIVPTEAE